MGKKGKTSLSTRPWLVWMPVGTACSRRPHCCVNGQPCREAIFTAHRGRTLQLCGIPPHFSHSARWQWKRGVCTVTARDLTTEEAIAFTLRVSRATLKAASWKHLSHSLRIPTGIWKQDDSLSPVSPAGNVSHLQVCVQSDASADSVYFTPRCGNLLQECRVNARKPRVVSK